MQRRRRIEQDQADEEKDSETANDDMTTVLMTGGMSDEEISIAGAKRHTVVSVCKGMTCFR